MLKPAVFVCCAMMSVAGVALGYGPGDGDEKPAAADAARTTPAAKVAAAGADGKELKLPQGFRPKKRGKYVLYCKSDSPLGSRIKQETCFDEDQLRDYMIALQETKGTVDRIRSTCANACACGQPGAC